MSRRVGATLALALLASLWGGTRLDPAAAQPGPARAGAAPPPVAAGGPGAFGLHVVAPTRAATGSVVAVRAAAHLAVSEDETRPLPGAEIRAQLVAADGKVLARAAGRSGGDGTADLRLRLPDLPPGQHTLKVEGAAPAGRAQHEGRLEITTGGRVLLTTDKPLYQPSQTIHFRALALRPIDLRPLGGRELLFEVEDPRGNLVLRQAATTSKFGVAAADLRLADEVNLGTYRIRAVIRPQAGLTEVRDERTVKVARYSPPRFKVTITPDRPFERPGAKATGVVEARYFFGKPVAHAQLWLDNGPYRVQGKTDAAGKYRYQMPTRYAGALTLTARVRDGAEHEESAARTIPVESEPFRVEVLPEGGEVVAGLENLIYVTAVAPDGEPVRGATVQGPGGAARTDDAGVAAVPYTPPAYERWRTIFTVTVRSAAGQQVRTTSYLQVSRSWSSELPVLLRPTRVLVPRGAPIGAEVVTSLQQGMAYLDVIKDGQTVRSVAAPVVKGRARLAAPADDAAFGSLLLQAQVVDGAGKRGAASRMVYVERQRALRLEVSPDRPSYAPGDRAVLRFRTVDASTGAGAPAQIGVVMVDDAVLAMAPMRTGMERVFFTLAREAESPRYALRFKPAGYTMERLVSESGRDAIRERVARVMLAGVVAPRLGRWETDPWRDRQTAWRAQVPRLARAVEEFMQRHDAGVRVGGEWRFREDLFPAMVAAGTLKAEEARDPWRRTVAPATLARVDYRFRFADYARRVVEAKQRRAYAKLTAGQKTLAREKVAGRPDRSSPHVFDTEDARRLCDARDLVDPWGNEMRVLRGTRYLYPYYGQFLSRWVLTSAGPDGEFGTDDDVTPPGDEYRPPKPGQKVKSARGGVLSVLSGTGYGYGRGGLGLRGIGAGGGGSGSGSIGLGSMGTIGRGGGERIRENFPETMLWKPDLLTDADGRAQLAVEVADSITTWRLLAVATAEDGRIGTAELGVRVFQDFFVDIDLPGRLTVGDEVAVPVAVYNYQKQPSHVLLRLEAAPWFERLSADEQAIDLGPGQVGVRYFRIRAARIGSHGLTVHARGGALTDAVKRSTRVAPDGVAVETSISERLQGGATQEIEVPADAIDGASRLAVRVFPGPMSQALDGLDGMIRMPSGCFEQTSSSTYPNALILEYLRRTRTGKAETLRKAEEYLALGYQRLLSFEVHGGGFSWFGGAPANQVLTAYGLNEFHDIARVRFVDRAVIDRTTRWLIAQQRADGGFDPDKENLFDGAVDAMAGNRVRTTAYVALALARSGNRGPAVKKAVAFVRAHLAAVKDPYTLALAADLLATVKDAEAPRVLGRLWAARQAERRGVSFAPAQPTLTHGGGRTGRIETTAIVAEAHYAARREPARAKAALDYLIASKDAFGSWSSTQATIMTLRALIAAADAQQTGRGVVGVTVDGVDVGSVALDERSGDVTHELDLRRFARPGKHRVSLAFRGSGEPMYQVVARVFRPRTAVAAPAPGALRLAVEYDRATLAPTEQVTARVRMQAAGGATIAMPVAEIGLPPGFAVDDDALEKLVKARRIDKYGRGAGSLILYLAELRPGRPLEIEIPMRAKMPARVLTPPSVAYEYYQPESRAEVRPQVLTVSGG
jgi:hypothetical protein